MQLTQAESAVAALVGLGFSNPQIALMRGCTEKTVKNQIRAIYAKGPAVNRNELRAQYTGGREGAWHGPQDYQSARS